MIADRVTHPIATRRLVGHNEDTLRQLCRNQDPDTPEKLRILLMREIMHAKNVPSTIDVGDVVEETVRYFMPFEEDLNPRPNPHRNGGGTLEEKTLKFLQDLQAREIRNSDLNWYEIYEDGLKAFAITSN